MNNIETFKDFVYLYQDIIGVKTYEIHITNQSKDARASIGVNEVNKIATIFYSNWWINQELTTEEIQRVAFHEVCHISLNKIKLALKPIYSEDYIKTIIHEQIRTMQNVFFNE